MTEFTPEEIKTALRNPAGWHTLAHAALAYIEELEANQAKAVEALEFYATQDVTYPSVGTVTFHGHDDNGRKARTTLAELKGQGDE